MNFKPLSEDQRQDLVVRLNLGLVFLNQDRLIMAMAIIKLNKIIKLLNF
jgi:hypothetical protein